MLKTFPIDFIRQTLEQKLLYEHLKDTNFFGGKEQVNILSFYEQLKSQDEVDRFVETYRDLADQQNRSGLILNGVVVSPENPSITNLYSSLIIPMTFTCSLRCMLENRDQAIITINNLIEKLKGRKVDIAQLNCVDDNGKPYSTPFMVGTIGQNDGEPKIKHGDFLGIVENINDVVALVSQFSYKSVGILKENIWLYCQKDNKLVVTYGIYNAQTDHFTWSFIEDDGTHQEIIFPPEHTSFEKYKVSFSFDAIRCDEPRNLNGKEYCELSFGGSATLVSKGVKLGNDLLKIFVKKLQIKASPSNIDLSEDAGAWLEPLELPSGNNANTQINQLVSKKFISNSHTDTIALTLQYTFVLDKDIPLLNQWFKYARYGIQGITKNDISPNIEYGINEIWCSWGELDVFSIITKIIENIDIDNTEADTLTLTTSMQIQGEWD